MTTRPLVSITIPTFNQQDMLPRAIESALAQNHEPLEIVIGDDASTDATAQVAARYGADRRIRYVHRKSNVGRVANYRRLLYEDARGDFVLNLDADDWLTDTTYIRDAADLLASDRDIVLVFARAWSYDQTHGHYVQDPERNRGIERINDGDDIFLAYPSGAVSIPHLTALYRRRDAMEVGLYSHDILGADMEGLIRLILGRRVGFLDRNAAVWRRHGANASSGRNVAARLRNLDSVELPYAEARRQGVIDPGVLERWRAEMAGRLYATYVVDSLREGDPIAAAQVLGAMAGSRPRLAWYVTRDMAHRATRRLLRRKRPILVDDA